MFHRRTLFILGAGASAEIGLPLGGGLASVIARKMDVRFETGNQTGTGDFDLYTRICTADPQDTSVYQKAAWLIRDGIHFARSIDDFLDMHRANPFVVKYGKVAIVKSVLEAENQSIMDYRDANGIPTFSPARFAGTWYTKLMQMLGPGIPREDVKDIFNRVSFVVFNYDRCLEFFLPNALQRLYGIREIEAIEICRSLDIIHPYGVIDTSVQYGSNQANYFALADGIKTYTEQISDPKITDAISDRVEKSEVIVFLGFAYHDQNMRLLEPVHKFPRRKPIYGTAFGMSDSDVGIISNQIEDWTSLEPVLIPKPKIALIENKLKCAELFDYYAKSFAAKN
jgi:hypothetical protein